MLDHIRRQGGTGIHGQESDVKRDLSSPVDNA